MATTIGLMDLPQEVLLEILRMHFASVEVNLIHPSTPGKQKKPRSQRFLALMLTNKIPCSISSEAYLEQATFRLKNYNQARYHFDDPTEYSERIGHLSGVLEYASLKPLALLRTKPEFGKVQSVVLKGQIQMDAGSECNTQATIV